jgi:signal transduction histidine kinase/ActR/RegA family two-component response regulator
MLRKLARSNLKSPYSIVVLATLGLLAVIIGHGLANDQRTLAFERLDAVQSAQSALVFVAKESANLRYWDSTARAAELDEVIQAREKSIKLLEEHLRAFVDEIGRAGADFDASVVFNDANAYLQQSNQTAMAWDRYGRRADQGLRRDLAQQIEQLRKLSTQTDNRLLKLELGEFLGVLSRTLNRTGIDPDRAPADDEDYKQVRKVLERLKLTIAAAGERSIGMGAGPLLSDETALRYLEARQDLGRNFVTRAETYRNFEKSINAALFEFIAIQKVADESYRTARLRSYQIVSYGCLAAILLIVAFGRIVALRIARASRRTAESEARFRDFSMVGSDIMLEVDVEGTVQFLIRGNKPLLPRLSPGLLGANIHEQTHLWLPMNSDVSLKDLLAQAKGFRGQEYRISMPNGRSIWRRVGGLPLLGPNQEFKGFRLSILDITDQKELERSAEERRVLYEQLVNQIPAGVFLSRSGARRDNPFTYVSPICMQMTGYNLEAANAAISSGVELMPEADIVRSEVLREQSSEGRSEIYRADGSVIPVIFKTQLLPQMSTDAPRQVLGLLIDISELEASNQRAESARHQFMTVLQNVGSAYFYTQRYENGRLIPEYASPSIESFLGITPAEWANRLSSGMESGLTLLAPSERDSVRDIIQSLLDGKLQEPKIIDSTRCYLRPDGMVVWGRSRGNITVLADGSIRQEAMVVDVTDEVNRQRHLELLSQENIAVVSALDSASDRIIIEGPDGKVSYVNKAVTDAWGTGRKYDLIGKTFLEAFPQLSTLWKPIEASVNATIEAKGIWTGSFDIKDSAVGDMNVDVRVAQLANQGKLYTAQDVTQRRVQEKREVQLKEQLLESQKMESIGRLAGGVAHDFNNILGAIRSFAGLIEGEQVEGSDSSSYAQRIIKSCDRAADIVRQILLYSRASAAEMKPVMIDKLVEEVQGYIRATLPPSVALKMTGAHTGATVIGNAGQLVQLLTNIAVNARDALGSSQGLIEISHNEVLLSEIDLLALPVGLSTPQGTRDEGAVTHQYVLGTPLSNRTYFQVTVSDDGPGIPEASLGRMFEPFFSTKDKVKSHGLGLAIVAAVAAAHGAFVVVHSQLGKGTQFSVYLPQAEGLQAANASPKFDTDPIRGVERILLVDDEIELADATALSLKRYGYKVAPIYGAQAGLNLFLEEPYAWDVVILDQVMPEMTGLELMAKIRAVRPQIPVILSTGFSDDASEEVALGQGAAGFVQKPADPRVLAKVVREALGASPNSPRA